MIEEPSRAFRLVARGERLSAALGRAHAVSALIALRESSPMGAAELTEAMGGYTGSGRAMGAHLELFGLARMDAMPGVAGKPAYAISLTEKGKRLADLLAQAVSVVPDFGEAGKGRK